MQHAARTIQKADKPRVMETKTRRSKEDGTWARTEILFWITGFTLKWTQSMKTSGIKTTTASPLHDSQVDHSKWFIGIKATPVLNKGYDATIKRATRGASQISRERETSGWRERSPDDDRTL
ncbi:MAG: hypothetical protein AEth_00648 [Candidatus Argoarchaeum ethanivorans]|uniref:Uncharacterized protein n=1 Tax=Candidatus Argoarchaeum ethanivorans TaxID=2608793 RepID=A0A8B3S3M8_9EURY|nr:MAG: hypothetical protein AEth_00648 [Candidatus Argoarchaeum ethanivorans]